MTELIQARGTVHGQTITLEQPLEIGEGEVVEITITRFPPPATDPLSPGDGVRQSAGAWAEDANDLDEFLEWNRRQRNQTRPEIEQ